MEREPGPENQSAGRAETDDRWSKKVEQREVVTLNAYQIDQMVASLGMCVAAVYELAEAMNVEDDARYRRKLVRSATKSVEEASVFLEDLTKDITK